MRMDGVNTSSVWDSTGARLMAIAKEVGLAEIGVGLVIRGVGPVVRRVENPKTSSRRIVVSVAAEGASETSGVEVLSSVTTDASSGRMGVVSAVVMVTEIILGCGEGVGVVAPSMSDTEAVISWNISEGTGPTSAVGDERGREERGEKGVGVARGSGEREGKRVVTGKSFTSLVAKGRRKLLFPDVMVVVRGESGDGEGDNEDSDEDRVIDINMLMDVVGVVREGLMIDSGRRFVSDGSSKKTALVSSGSRGGVVINRGGVIDRGGVSELVKISARLIESVGKGSRSVCVDSGNISIPKMFVLLRAGNRTSSLVMGSKSSVDTGNRRKTSVDVAMGTVETLSKNTSI